MGDQAAARLQVTVFDGGRGQPARRCGPACRVADLTLSGGETLRVGVAGAGGGTATLVVPTLPASDAAGLVARAEARMHDLVTYRVDETLRPATEPLAVTYAYQVPDRLSFQVQRGGETVIVGGARYWRASAGAAWQRSPVPPVAVPSFAWDAAEIVAPRALGTSVEDGRALNGAAFFEDPGAAPVWFELWMDDQGLVRRAEMRALGHFMEDRYRDFDARFSIEPPAT